MFKFYPAFQLRKQISNLQVQKGTEHTCRKNFAQETEKSRIQDRQLQKYVS
jgi:hypothetical protein